MNTGIAVPIAELLADTPVPRHEAERLLMAAAGLDRAALYGQAAVAPAVADRFRELVRRRASGEPLQYLEGAVSFGPLELAIDRRALIPRPETERMWELACAALGEAGPGTAIVDLCTGSGALALALKHRFPEARVVATDISEDALALAGENAARTGLEVELREGDLFEALEPSLKGRIDLLVANPPYVAKGEMASLPPDVRDHEPHLALVAGERGTEILERIADEAPWWLGTGGWLFVEIGETQADVARALFGAWLDVDVLDDLAGRPRILVGRKGGRCCW